MTSLERQLLNRLTELCNCIDKEKAVIAFGDVLLETLEYGLTKLKISKNPVKTHYVDCSQRKIADILPNALTTSTLGNVEMIYLLDNAESIGKKDADLVLKLKKLAMESSKSMILICEDWNSLSQQLQTLKKFKLGEMSQDQFSLQRIVLEVFGNPNREMAFFAISNSEFPIPYVFSLLSYNVPFFYPAAMQQQAHDIIERSSSYLFKADSDIVLRFLCQSIQTTKIRKVIRYPPKLKVKEDAAAS